VTQVEYALALAALGWPVFPCGEDKRPLGSLVTHGFKEATTNPRKIMLWWKIEPDALIGVALPDGTIAVDVDDWEKFRASGLDLPPTKIKQTTPSGGEHDIYRLDHEAPQTVKRHPGVDTRVGGKGYVVAWQPEAWTVRPEDLDLSPVWVYDEEDRAPRSRPKNSVPAEEALIGEDGITHRNDIIRWVGTLRGVTNATDAEILKLLLGRLADGYIVDGDESRPWTPEDMAQIVKGTKDWVGPEREREFSVRRVKAERPPRPALTPVSAEDLREKELTPLEYLVEDVLPEGLGVIAGAPKVGKSWLVYQVGVEIATGGELLGKACEARDVLYYALEDGERRLQERLEILIGGRHLDLSRLFLFYEAPRISDGLEEDVASFLDSHPGGLVILDVLAKIRPKAVGKGSAYDEDYSVISPLQTVARDRPGSAIVVVTHDRKAGSDDWMTTVTGTRGIVGAADWVWVVKRDREKKEGIIYVSGRDVHDAHIDALFAGAWSLGSPAAPGTSDKQRQIADALRTEGDMTAKELALFFDSTLTGKELDNARGAMVDGLKKLERDHHVTPTQFVKGRGIPYHILSDDEKAERFAVNHDAHISIRRVSRAPASAQPGAPARAHVEPHPQVPQVPHAISLPEDPEDSELGVHTRARPRAQAVTAAGAREEVGKPVAPGKGTVVRPASTRAARERRLS
jgi:hypothetical protein